MKTVKRFLILLLISMVAADLPQPLKGNVRLEVEHIKANKEYIYGEGWGATPGDADKVALANLLSKIGTTVESGFYHIESESTSSDGNIDYQQEVKSIMNTYSQATLNNTETKTFNDGSKGFYLIRYMKRDELDKMFAQRRDRVEDYVRSGVRSEEKGRIDDALRFYSWAFVLLHSLQYPAEVKMNILGENRLLINWIPSQIRTILKGINVEVAEVKPGNIIDLVFKYNGNPVEGLDFTYWNGRINSPIIGVKNGISQLSFPADYDPKEVILSVETKYQEAAMSDKELEMMMRGFKMPVFSEARLIIGDGAHTLKEGKGSKKLLQQMVESSKKEGIAKLDKKSSKEYEAIMDKVIKSIISKNFTPDKEIFTEEGLDMFRKLLVYGNVSVIGTPDPEYYPFGSRVVCRSIPMQFSFKNNNRVFIEDVTFTFSPDKKIESIAFGLGEAARRDIFSQGGDVWGDSVKMVIATFLENYKTAFALKRLDYIKSIFDENAYIIVGHKLHKLQHSQGDSKGISIGTDYTFQSIAHDIFTSVKPTCF